MDLLAITFASALALGAESGPIASIWPEAMGEVPAHVPAPEPVRGASSRPKSWVWLRSQGCYGFGYPRADGLWVIDPGSKVYPRASEPTPVYYNPGPVLYGNYGGCSGGSCGAGFR